MLDLIVAVSIIIISSAVIAYVAWVFRRSAHLERDYVRALEESAPIYGFRSPSIDLDQAVTGPRFQAFDDPGRTLCYVRKSRCLGSVGVGSSCAGDHLNHEITIHAPIPLDNRDELRGKLEKVAAALTFNWFERHSGACAVVLEPKGYEGCEFVIRVPLYSASAWARVDKSLRAALTVHATAMLGLNESADSPSTTE